ncbi:hypothetical protein ACE1CI_18270 [Aerosakkonemataceae cyanobacterium BLCC-F50]|uniref:Ycf15 n=1 Tax=Floridaenema flaviceps BLCC-F50 TaxID=3153642 RepID=A0ABV4XUB5_9CYAN
MQNLSCGRRIFYLKPVDLLSVQPAATKGGNGLSEEQQSKLSPENSTISVSDRT